MRWVMDNEEMPDFVRSSSLYKEFLAEHEEIMKNKWFMSEKAKTDVGFDRAFIDWIIKYKSGWKNSHKPKQ